jgi:electron transport complex protein RnfD
MKDFHVDKGTYIKQPNTVDKMYMHIYIALIPIVLFSIYKNGVNPYIKESVGLYGLLLPLIIMLISIITASFTEMLYIKVVLKDNKKIIDLLLNPIAILPGLIMSLLIPITTPLLLVLLGSFLGTIIGKMLFGGHPNNKLNPALVGQLVIMIILTMIVSNNYSNPYELHNNMTNSPIINAMNLKNIGSYKEIITPFRQVRNFFIGNIPGAIGTTSVLLSILAFIYLAINKVIKWKISITYLLAVFIMTFIIGNYNGLGLWYPLFHLISGGLVFISIFMVTDFVTTPTTPIGQILFGLYAGILTVVFRFLKIEMEGAAIAILIMNSLSVLIDYIGATARYSFKKSIVLFVIAWILLISVSTYLAIIL